MAGIWWLLPQEMLIPLRSLFLPHKEGIAIVTICNLGICCSALTLVPTLCLIIWSRYIWSHRVWQFVAAHFCTCAVNFVISFFAWWCFHGIAVPESCLDFRYEKFSQPRMHRRRAQCVKTQTWWCCEKKLSRKKPFKIQFGKIPNFYLYNPGSQSWEECSRMPDIGFCC